MMSVSETLGAVSAGAVDLEIDLPWYVAHTKVRQEQLACDNLVRQGYRVYFPKIKVLKRLRGRQQAQFEALFPRYVFLQPESRSHSIAPVRSTFGVSSLVRFGQEPAIMRASVLRGIHSFEMQRNNASIDEISPFNPGSRVQVVDGPLAGLDGLVSDVSHERVIVLMQLLGQETRVNVSYHQLVVVH